MGISYQLPSQVELLKVINKRFCRVRTLFSRPHPSNIIIRLSWAKDVQRRYKITLSGTKKFCSKRLMPDRPPPLAPSLPTNTLTFLTFPPEIRQIVYHHLLTFPLDIYIAQSLFKRHKRPSWYADPSYALKGDTGVATIYWASEITLPAHPLQAHKTNGDGHWTGIVWTCRTVYNEAFPLLYTINTFHFENAGAAQALRWSSPYALALRRIHIVLSPVYKEFDNRVHKYADGSWAKYLETERFSLGKEYPNLRHLTLTLGRGLEVEPKEKLEHRLRPFRKGLRGISVLEVIGLNDESILRMLFPVVMAPECMAENVEVQEGRKERVQIKLSDYAEMPGWKNAILWWGRDGEGPPVEGRPFPGDKRYRRRLYRVDMGGGRVEMSVGDSIDIGVT